MTYTAAAGIGIVAALLLDLAVLRTRLVTRAVFWWTYPVILIFQLIANGVLTGRGVVRYAPGAIIGWRIAYAPVEDLGFGFALVLCTLSVWVWLGRIGLDRRPMAGERPGAQRRPAGERRGPGRCHAVGGQLNPRRQPVAGGWHGSGGRSAVGGWLGPDRRAAVGGWLGPDCRSAAGER